MYMYLSKVGFSVLGIDAEEEFLGNYFKNTFILQNPLSYIAMSRV